MHVHQFQLILCQSRHFCLWYIDDPVNPDCVDCGSVLVTALVECAVLEMRPPDLDAIYAFKYESL